MTTGWGLPKEERAARLREVAALIEQIPDAEYTLEHWWCEGGMAYDEERNKMYRVAPGDCGCPVGHMAKRGLFGVSYEELLGHGIGRQRTFVIIGGIFGVTYSVAEFMFDQYGYSPRDRSRAAVLRRVLFVIGEIERGAL
jgi:hypothetical protein